MLSIAILSSWHVHTDDYARQIRESGKASIAAMWDEDAERGKLWAEKNGVEFAADIDALLARPDIDAVVCNAPTTMHPALLTKAAKAGKHIFTEKVLAAGSAECEALCDAIRQSGVVFTISLPLRQSPKMLYAKQIVDSGTLGRVSAARMRRSHSGVSDHWLPERWFDLSSSGGGAMMDLGAHPVYLLSFLFGAPKRVAGMSTKLFDTSSDENAIALAEFAGGILATAETAFVTNGVPDILEIYGTEGSLFIRGEDVCLVTHELRKQGIEEHRPAKLPKAHPSAMEQFIEACLTGGESPEHLGLEDALLMTRFIEAFYQSDNTNKIIKTEESQ